MDTHRQQLSEFLKACRARVTPDELGLPDGGRRRTPGLRREDVAAVAGVSVTWYTWLEQGRDIRVSANVLDRVSSALKLSADERDFLFSLVQHRPAPPLPHTSLDVSDTLQRMVDSLGVPTLVLTERWDVIAWNRLAAAVFRDYSELAPKDRNLFRFLMLNEEYQLPPDEYEEMARRIVPKFRVDYSHSGNPESFEELIADISAQSEKFREIWSSPDISSKSIGINAVRHPRLGGITFEHSTYVPEGSPGLRVMVFAPYDDESARKLHDVFEDF
jgi:transcriptional regulator with XRE-family HTH domain